jgi:hypothetical protein
MDVSTMGTQEGIGDGFLPFRLHAGGAGGLKAHPPAMEQISRAVKAVEVATLDLDAGRIGKWCSHGMGFSMIDNTADTTNQTE